MIILAFDLATETGVAFGAASDPVPRIRTERLGDPGDSQAQRFHQLHHVSRKLIREVGPGLVVIEAAVAAGPAGAQSRVQLAMGYRAMVLLAAHLAGVRVDEHHVGSIRKHFLGSAKHKRDAAKFKTIQRCKALGWKVQNDNEADACALFDYARAKLRLGTTETPDGLFEHERGDIHTGRRDRTAT